MKFVVPPEARSWVSVAEDSHFPIQNLPFVGFSAGASDVRLGTRIGDSIVDLAALCQKGLLTGVAATEGDPFKSLFSQGAASSLREQCYRLLDSANPKLRDDAERKSALHSVADVKLHRIRQIGAFVDFYSGINHASNVGKMFRPDQPPLLPNYRHLPVGYNGRASTVVLSGEPVFRPNGQQKIGDAVVFGPSKELDFELEMGFFLSLGSDRGTAVPIGQCEEHMLGVVLVNDWSARDVQRWEYQPLGPFLAKSFATSISPYVVTLDALEPFRVQGPSQEPTPLPHLQGDSISHFDVQLEVYLQTPRMSRPQRITATNSRELYWSFAQQLAHQSSNGTTLEAGDLYASGTISGTEPGSFGSLLELTWRGSQPLTMDETGEQRTFLEDGDTVIMTGWCQGDGYRVGFGEVRATIAPG